MSVCSASCRWRLPSEPPFGRAPRVGARCRCRPILRLRERTISPSCRPPAHRPATPGHRPCAAPPAPRRPSRGAGAHLDRPPILAGQARPRWSSRCSPRRSGSARTWSYALGIRYRYAPVPGVPGHRKNEDSYDPLESSLPVDARDVPSRSARRLNRPGRRSGCRCASRSSERPAEHFVPLCRSRATAGSRGRPPGPTSPSRPRPRHC
jgi:hypothetical protein